jgi:hypothetical protein
MGHFAPMGGRSYNQLQTKSNSIVAPGALTAAMQVSGQSSIDVGNQLPSQAVAYH